MRFTDRLKVFFHIPINARQKKDEQWQRERGEREPNYGPVEDKGYEDMLKKTGTYDFREGFQEGGTKSSITTTEEDEDREHNNRGWDR